MKYYIKKDKNEPHKCIEPCKFMCDEENTSEILRESIGIKIGSGFCQGCKHHKNNNIIESHGKNYDVFTHGSSVKWIECDKL